MSASSPLSPASWKVESIGEEIFVQNAAVSFLASTAGGLLLKNIQWHGAPEMHVPEQIHLQLAAGLTYHPRELNMLAEILQGGRERALEYSLQGEVLKITGCLMVAGFSILQVCEVQANGSIVWNVRITRIEPGKTKIQPVLVGKYKTLSFQGGKQFGIWMRGVAGPTMFWDYEKPEHLILDQDSRAMRRSLLLRESLLFAGRHEDKHLLSYSMSGEAAVAAWHVSPASSRMILSLYGPEFKLREGDNGERQWTLLPVHNDKLSKPAPSDPVTMARLQTEVDLLLKRATGIQAADTVQRVRLENLRYALNEASWYLALEDFQEAEDQLRDARQAWQMWEEKSLPCVPDAGEILYEQSFHQMPSDWSFFGWAAMKVDAQNGLHLAPSTTVNLWSHREFQGPLVVEMDYRTEADAASRGGTFVQLYGQPVNPRAATDFMVSATGNMPDYMFGVKCYHFSFNRRSEADRQVTNFRKTGDAFYLLAQGRNSVEKPERWYKLQFVHTEDDRFLFFVDGELITEYCEQGNHGSLYRQGHLGIRHWGGMSAWVRNLRVYRPAPQSTETAS